MDPTCRLDEPGSWGVVLPTLQVQYFPGFKGSNCWRILKKKLSSIIAVFCFILAHRQQQQIIFLWWNGICCKLESDASDRVQSERPEAGRHPGLFQISRLFITRFPADFPRSRGATNVLVKRQIFSTMLASILLSTCGGLLYLKLN